MPKSCPEKALLEQLLYGKVPESNVAPLEEHILECLACAQTIESLSSQDTLAEVLRSRGLPVQPESVQALMQQVKARLKTVGSTSDFATQGFDGETTSASEVFHFLAPAQGPDEIGRLGSYRILKVLGLGGMGVVFAAEDLRLGRACAVKAMLPEIARKASARERFLREAKAAGNLDHDHIVAIYQVDEANGIPFIAMPLLTGASLDDWLKKRGTQPVTVAQILKIGRETAKGLAAAHAKGLIHRDIKPANLWLDANAGGRVKILDFGLARATSGEQNLTQSGAIVGTPAYMAPEQARGEKIDARADLFSLGCVLYRLCTGVVPFKGIDTMSTLMALATHDPAAPITLNPNLPRELSDLVMNLLHKDVQKRVATAQDVVKALQAIDPAKKPTETMIRDSLPSAAPAAAPTTPSMVPTAIDIARPSRRRYGVIGIIALLLVLVPLGLWMAGVIFRVETDQGTLVVEINDADVEARIKDGKLLLAGPDGKVRYTLTPADRNNKLDAGAYKIKVEGADGLALDTPEFQLKKGAVVTVRVTLERPPVSPVARAGENYALKLAHRQKVTVPAPLVEKMIAAKEYTMEAFVRPDQIQYNTAANVLDAFGHTSLDLLPYGGGWTMAEFGGKRWTRGVPAKVQEAVHLAGVVTRDQYKLYVDGQLKEVLDAPASSRRQPTKDLFWIGGRGNVTYIGQLDEIRISKGARYDANFTPTLRHEPDGDTLALYHCDEGKGEVLVDSSGNGNHGKVEGATWVKAEFPALAPVTPVVADKDLIQGEWHASAMHVNGQPLSPALLAAKKLTASFDGDRMSFVQDGKLQEGTFRLEPDKNPKQIDVIREPDQKGMRGIYRLKDGELELCMGEPGTPRPTTFASTAGSTLMAVVLRRPERFALRFEDKDRTDHVAIPTVKLDIARPYTVEAWVTVQQSNENFDDIVGLPGMHVALIRGHVYFFQRCTPKGDKETNFSVSSSLPLAKGQRAHIAAVRSEKGLHLYVNGKLAQETASFPPEVALEGKGHPAYLGNSKFSSLGPEGSPRSAWLIEQVRISKAARFAKEFNPADRFEKDADTVALYRFDEGQGDKLADASGNGHHGTIVGAKWVKSDGSPIATPESTNFAMVFDGKAAHVVIPSLKLETDQPLTIEAWAKFDKAGGINESIASFYSAESGVLLSRMRREASFRAQRVRTASHAVQEGAMDNDAWKHLAGVWDGKKARLYVDGKLLGSKTTRETGSPAPAKQPQQLYLGADSLLSEVQLHNFFRGLMDEVRISKIARYDAEFTPAKRLDADQDTLALYHFDEGAGEVLKDSSGNGHHGKVVGAKWVKADGSPVTPPPVRLPALNNFALEFDGKFTHVAIPSLRLETDKPVTIEGWAKFEKARSVTETIASGYSSKSALLLCRMNGASPAFLARRNLESKFAGLDGVMADGVWTHIAGVWDGKNVALFVNGKRQTNEVVKQLTPLQTAPQNQHIYLGADRVVAVQPLNGFFHGVMDEVRLSKVARYARDFAPSPRFEADKDTLALYHFDEGEGDNLVDASGNEHHGKIVSGKWVKADKALVSDEVANSIGMRLRLIPAGKFMMGNADAEKDGRPQDGPPREVTLTRPFRMGVHEVTQEQYAKVMGNNPSMFKLKGKEERRVFGLDTARFPVDSVSWVDAVEFCRKLSEREEEKQAGRVYRLPTEAEWEYACRAGTSGPFHTGAELKSSEANYDKTALSRPTPVGSYPPNAFGLHDMHGNVFEWCEDWFATSYKGMPTVDPRGPTQGTLRVARGGNWGFTDYLCRSTARDKFAPTHRAGGIGLRVVCDVGPAPAATVDPNSGPGVLARFVGVWNGLSQQLIPEPKTPKDARFSEVVFIERVGGDKFLRFNGVYDDGRVENLSILTYDENAGEFQGYYLNSTGYTAGPDQGTWDAKTQTLTRRDFLKEPKIETVVTMRFADADTIHTHIVNKKQDGEVVFELRSTLTRADRPVAPLTPPLDPQRPAEVKRLDMFVGLWRNDMKMQAAPALDKEVDVVTNPQIKSILGGCFIDAHEENADLPGQKDYWIMGWHEPSKKYRFWHFSASGGHGVFAGTWTAADRKIAWKSLDGHMDGSWTMRLPHERDIEYTVRDPMGATVFVAKGVSRRIGGDRYTNALGMEFARVPKGRAWLKGDSSKPGDPVEMASDFYMGVFEVTQEEWQKVMGSNPSHFSRTGAGKDIVKGAADDLLKRYPVENVSWEDCQKFVAKLNEMTPEKGWTYRLPTEQEWEYTCRGGPMANRSISAFDFYLDTPQKQLLPFRTNFKTNVPFASPPRPGRVGVHVANPLGLHDMHGNVWEWCEDILTDAKGARVRANRGGSWSSDARSCAAAYRNLSPSSERNSSIGLRLARVAVEPKENTVDTTGAARKLQDEWATKRKLSVEVENKVGMKLRLIPPGEGVAEGFYIGKYEVTQGEWQKVLGGNPSLYNQNHPQLRGLDASVHPVEHVNWYECVEFCNKLSEREGLKAYYELKVTKRKNSFIEEAEVKVLGGTGYRLPTDAEWTHACRAGTKFKFSFGDKAEELFEHAWFDKNGESRPHAVGGKKPNGFGLHDMHGNVRELIDGIVPNGTTGAPELINRGGHIFNSAEFCMVTHLFRGGPVARASAHGVRIARSVPRETAP